MATRFKKGVVLTVPYQMISMATKYPNFKCIQWNKNFVRWEGSLRPSTISAEYNIRIDYSLNHGSGARPKVFVLSPKLVPIEGVKRLIHVFKENELCLLRFKYFDWDDALLSSDTL